MSRFFEYKARFFESSSSSSSTLEQSPKKMMKIKNSTFYFNQARPAESMEADDARFDDAHSVFAEATMNFSTTAQRASTPCFDELENTPPPAVAPELSTGAIFAKVQVPDLVLRQLHQGASFLSRQNATDLWSQVGHRFGGFSFSSADLWCFQLSLRCYLSFNSKLEEWLDNSGSMARMPFFATRHYREARRLASLKSIYEQLYQHSMDALLTSDVGLRVPLIIGSIEVEFSFSLRSLISVPSGLMNEASPTSLFTARTISE